MSQADQSELVSNSDNSTRAARIMGKIIITIILVIIEITIIQTILFEFENMLYLFSISPKKYFVTAWELLNFALKKYTKWSKRKCSIRKEYADRYPAVLPFL